MKDVIIATDGHTRGRTDIAADVRDYGAKGDGIMDDTERIQEAADSLSDTGGTVFLPVGTYNITSVTLPSNVSLVGADKRHCKLALIGNAYYMLRPGSHSSIVNLTISSTEDVWLRYGILSNGEDFVIENCDINLIVPHTAAMVIAIAVSNTVEGEVGPILGGAGAPGGEALATILAMSNTNITMTTTGEAWLIGLTAMHSADEVIVRDCTIRVESTSTWANAFYGRGATFRGCTLEGATSVVNCLGPVTCEQCFIEGIAAGSYGAYIATDGCKFYDCTIKKGSAATDCIHCSTSKNICVAHCRFNDASPLHSNLTNLIETPYNVADTDV